MRSITTEVLDSGAKRDSCGRRVSTEQRRGELLAAYDSSGLTQKAFAEREGLNVPGLIDVGVLADLRS
jgi:hypothetical protein